MMTFTNYNKDHKGDTTSSVSLTVHNDASIHDVMLEFRRFLLACSYAPSSVDLYIEEE